MSNWYTRLQIVMVFLPEDLLFPFIIAMAVMEVLEFYRRLINGN